ncbi:MAG: acyltransferase [Anaerolineae bacterium]|nr:acyltransferase [Anaerolineae bacterium]
MTNQAYQLGLAGVGQDVFIWSLAKITSPEVITIGDSVIVDDFVFLMGGMKTVIGSFIHIASFTSITGGGELIMEDFSGFSSGVRVFTGNEDYSGNSFTNPAVPARFRHAIRSFVHLKKFAVVGANSVIMPGVTIGEGVVIGANSFVTRDCKPWTVYVGSPARPVRERPKEHLFALEADLRQQLFDASGAYVPVDQRPD